MQRDIFIGLGAGLAAAILALAPASGSLLGLMLAFFAALPITVVTLVWSYRAGLVAGAAAIGILAGVVSLHAGLNFGVAFALPAWALAFLAISGFDTARPDERPIPIGTIGVVAGVLGTASVLFVMLMTGSSYADSLLAAEKDLSDAYRIMMQLPKDQPITLADGTDASSVIAFFGRLILPMKALVTTVASLCGLWLSGRVAVISGRLPRPWPDVAADFRLPSWSLALFALGCLVSLMPDTYGFAGQLVAAALLGLLAVQGFAVVHFVTRGHAARPLLLTIVYLLFVLLSSVVLVMAALLGLLDLFFNLRRRSGSNGRPHSPAP